MFFLRNKLPQTNFILYFCGEKSVLITDDFITNSVKKENKNETYENRNRSWIDRRQYSGNGTIRRNYRV